MPQKQIPLEWSTQKRKVSDLVPYEFNPRSLTEEKKKILIESIQKFNLVEIPVINLDNTILAGHQRMYVMIILERGDEMIDVRVPNRLLTDQELREYNLRSNIGLGDWVEEMLNESFSDIDLPSLGLNLDIEFSETIQESQKVEEFESKFHSIPNKPKYPIVAKFNEKYSAVIIIAKNVTDLTFLQTVLDLPKEASYKSDRVGQTHVLTSKKFQKLWEKK